MDVKEFANDVSIDINQLDVEAARQAETFFKWAERATEARALVDEAKLQLDTTEAKLQLDCRKNPRKFGLERVTEATIVAAVKVSKRYIRYYDRWIRRRRTSAMLANAVMAMEQKKKAIENLITLHGQQYFAGPSVPRDLAAAWMEYSQEREGRVADKQRNLAKKKRKRTV